MQTGPRIHALLLSPLYDQAGELPPMGLACLAGYFRDHPRISLHIPHRSLTDKNHKALLEEREYDAVCTGGMLTSIDAYQRFLADAAAIQPKALRVLGGPIVSAFPGQRLLEELDFHAGVMGEGEATLEDLLLARAEGRGLAGVPGLVFRDLGGAAVCTAPRKPLDIRKRDLRPDWTICDLEQVFARCGGRTLPILGSRGCPNRCHYCNSTIRGYRLRPVEHFIDEIRQLKDDFALDSLIFRDETFMANPKRIREFCRAYAASGIGLPWCCGLRANLVDAETLDLMRQAGCIEIQYGVESGSDAVLRRMNKHVSAAQNRQAILLTQAAGIHRGVSVMFGYLDETKDEVGQTIDLLIETNELPKYYSLTTPVPGTPLFDDCAARGLVGDPVAHARTMNKAIYLGFAPNLNMSAIEDRELFPFLREELARLFTAHFQRNQARVRSFGYEQGAGGSWLAECSHCGAELREGFQSLKWSYQLYCPHCRRHTWAALASVPLFQEHFEAVGRFLDRLDAQGGGLVLRATQNDFIYGNIVKVDPWGRIMARRPKVVCPTPYRFHLEAWDGAEPAAAASWALIMDQDPGGLLAAELAAQGFAPERIQALLPAPERVAFAPDAPIPAIHSAHAAHSERSLHA